MVWPSMSGKIIDDVLAKANNTLKKSVITPPATQKPRQKPVEEEETPEIKNYVKLLTKMKNMPGINKLKLFMDNPRVVKKPLFWAKKLDEFEGNTSVDFKDMIVMFKKMIKQNYAAANFLKTLLNFGIDKGYIALNKILEKGMVKKTLLKTLDNKQEIIMNRKNIHKIADELGSYKSPNVYMKGQFSRMSQEDKVKTLEEYKEDHMENLPDIVKTDPVTHEIYYKGFGWFDPNADE